METDSELFPGEDLGIGRQQADLDPAGTDAEINEKYVKGDIRIITEQARYPLPSIKDMLSGGNYEVNPEFQRRHRWDLPKKSRLIESFIMNVPVPPIFLYESRFSYYEVMDGLQRLTAINEFYKDIFQLTELEHWPELNGRTYTKLPEQVKRGIDRRYLSSIILLQETAKTEMEAQQLKQLVFERINSGGVKLEPQESRNAIYNGPLNTLCIRLSRKSELCKMWGIPEPDYEELTTERVRNEVLSNPLYQKMDDVELVLRFFAYRQRLHNHKGALKSYLDMYLRIGNNFEPRLLNALKELFIRTTELIWQLLGEKAFWLLRKRGETWGWYQRPTTAVYDPLMYVCSKHLNSESVLIGRRKDIQAELPEFYKLNYRHFEGRYTNLANVVDRNRLFMEFIGRFL